jgi:cysteine synthase B
MRALHTIVLRLLAVMFSEKMMHALDVKSQQVLSRRELVSGLFGSVGNTPIYRLARIASFLPSSVEIYGKAEWFNPGGSVKDRPAAGILRHTLMNGLLHEGKTFLDSTSGNMGIAYATLGASLGIPIHLTIPANTGEDRLSILRSLGAELTLTDPLEGSDGARNVAAKMAINHPHKYYYADQYSHTENWQAHFDTTGPEIMSQTSGRITHFVAGLGTTGTLMGTGRYLKNSSSDIQLVAVQPDGPMHGLEGLKHLPSSDIPPIYDPSFLDETVSIETTDAYEMARAMAREEGLLIGISAAATAVAALEIAARLDSGVIVVIFPDSGVKYLQQPFWREA